MAVERQNKELLSPNLEFQYCSASTCTHNNIKLQNWSSLFCSYDSSSELNSPVESELGWTETTDSSEERDDYMAQYMFEDDNKQVRIRGFTGLAQSMQWSPLGFSQLEPSREPSSPLTPIIPNAHTPPELSYDGESLHATSIGFANINLEHQTLVDDQIKATQLYRLKQEQIMKHQQSLYIQNQFNASPKHEYKQHLRNFNNNRLSNTQNGQWHALKLPERTVNHQRGGSERRAVFLNGSRSGGTGVFLPRGVGNSNESCKKSGCSTVLIPERVVQALKLHFDKLDATSRSNSLGFTSRHDALKGGRSHTYTQQETETQGRTVPTWNHQEIGLPQEWTY